MRIFISLIFIFLLVVTLVLLISKNPFIKKDEGFSKNEITESNNEKKLLDLTSLSERISKKILKLELSDVNLDKKLLGEKNPNAYKEILNFEDTFQDIIPGDILTIDLFEEGIFQKEIKVC